MAKKTKNKRLDESVGVSRAVVIGLAALCAVVALIIYLPTLNGTFVNWDDGLYIYENGYMLNPAARSIKWLFTAVVAANWHPLTLLSYVMDSHVWGLAPRGFHFTNILLHSANSALVFFLALMLFKRAFDEEEGYGSAGVVIAATVTALLFGTHPIHVESVAWISERKDVLYSFFYLFSVIAYLKYTRASGAKDENKKLYYVLSLFLFILSLMSKPMAITLPVVLLLVDYYPLKRSFNTALKEKLPFFALSVSSAIVTLWAQSAGGAIKSFESFPFITRIFVAIRAYVFYIYKTFLPVELAPLYPYPKDISFISIEALGSLIVLILITIAAIYLLRRSRSFLALWLFFILSLAPVIGIIQVGAQPAADRYLYLPILALFLLVGAGFSYVAGRLPLKKGIALAVVVAIAILVPLSIKSSAQIKIWKGPLALWGHEVKIYPVEVPVAHNNIGDYYSKIMQHASAIEHFTRAVELDDEYFKAFYNRGVAFYHTGDIKGALEDYTRAVEINPSFAVGYYNRGTTYSSIGLLHEAGEDFTRAIALRPEYSKAYNNRGNVYYKMGQNRLAIIDYTSAIGLSPSLAQAYSNRGAAHLNLGEISVSIEDYTRALAIDQNPLYYNNRGNAFLRLGDIKSAVDDYNASIRLAPEGSYGYLGLGKAFTMHGDKTQAMKFYRRAAELGSDEALKALEALIDGSG